MSLEHTDTYFSAEAKLRASPNTSQIAHGLIVASRWTRTDSGLRYEKSVLCDGWSSAFIQVGCPTPSTFRHISQLLVLLSATLVHLLVFVTELQTVRNRLEIPSEEFTEKGDFIGMRLRLCACEHRHWKSRVDIVTLIGRRTSRLPCLCTIWREEGLGMPNIDCLLHFRRIASSVIDLRNLVRCK